MNKMWFLSQFSIFQSRNKQTRVLLKDIKKAATDFSVAAFSMLLYSITVNTVIELTSLPTNSDVSPRRPDIVCPQKLIDLFRTPVRRVISVFGRSFAHRRFLLLSASHLSS